MKTRVIILSAALALGLLIAGIGPAVPEAAAQTFTVTSSAFKDGGSIPVKYAATQVKGRQYRITELVGGRINVARSFWKTIKPTRSRRW